MATLTQDTAHATELRHITSNSHLASPPSHVLSNRASQHLRTHRLGSRSPASIPSSPTSVHSSSSAIFERDIEPLAPSPSAHHSLDPHRMPRGKATEQLDAAVPSVLDSAAAVLTSTSPQDEDEVAIALPRPPSGFASPTSRMSSRSPSPQDNRRSMLLNMPSPSPSFTLPLPISQGQTSSPQRPTVQVADTPEHDHVDSNESSPTTATHHDHPLRTLSLSPTSGSPPSTTSPPSPQHISSKRLSFISYTDLLTSAPSSTLPLSSLTSFALVSEPPPHISSVIGLPQVIASASASMHGGSRRASMHGDAAAGIIDDVGGEWEREGLGKGLEERLEGLMTISGRV